MIAVLVIIISKLLHPPFFPPPVLLTFFVSNSQIKGPKSQILRVMVSTSFFYLSE